VGSRSNKNAQDPVLAALGRIQETGAQIRRWLGPEGADVPPETRAEAVVKLAGAGEQRAVEELRAEIRELQDAAIAVSEAQQQWRPIFRARDRVVLANGTGATTTIPAAVARVIARGGSVDVEVVAERGGLALRYRGERVAWIPRSLVPQLDTVLGQIDWTDNTPRPPAVDGRTP